MSRYALAATQYGELGIDTDSAIAAALAKPISIHCWQGDDVRGFEVQTGSEDSGGILATGSFPGRARNGDELREDFQQVLRLVPGAHRINLHAIYAECEGSAVPRDELSIEHFKGWIDWAKDHSLGIDFNPTYFAHPMASSGRTLSSDDPKIRDFWIRHGVASRKIAAGFAAELGGECINNHWIPDGAKDSPVDRWTPREVLLEAFREIFAEPLPGCTDSVESKLFGLGSEDYVVGSFEFYSHLALQNGLVFCLDMGHFHPTETIPDKLSSLLQFHRRLLIHASRPMRWDSDHVVLFNDDLRAVFHELVRGRALDRAIVALDFFDASINRIAAYAIGIRATRKALLYALLEPVAELQTLERNRELSKKLALLEDLKTMPFGAVWDELCDRAGVARDRHWMDDVDRYEREVLSRRGP